MSTTDQARDMSAPEAATFSEPGAPCTSFERVMVTLNLPRTQLERIAHELAVRFGAHVAADTMAILCDELGGTQPYIAPRRTFFRRMYLRHRNEQFATLAASGWTLRQIADAYGCAEATVSRGIAACDGTCAFQVESAEEAS